MLCSFVAVIVALIVTMLAAVILCAVLGIIVMWYYAVCAVVLGVFVGDAAMFGFDKFKATWDKLQALRNIRKITMPLPGSSRGGGFVHTREYVIPRFFCCPQLMVFFPV